MDIEMKIQPSFIDHECAIVFSFYFSKNAKKIGEAVVFTYGEAPCEEIESNRRTTTHHHPAGQKKKIAYLKEHTICEEYIKISLNKIHHFLNIIGIHTCISK
ncbi:hypothetical protein [Bacillus dakarensis]|uniref:hypothetical protein n=1 Tax=Robertmurraya dakarensis TaxID=1926278 RepID=UPI0009825BF9|nr:hypothetical protein [Bacillus dakarensis]